MQNEIRLAAVLFLVSIGSGKAQQAVMGNNANLLSTSFCTFSATCKLLASYTVGSVKTEIYSATQKRPIDPKYPARYTVTLDRIKGRVVSMKMEYPPAQDTLGDVKERVNFMSSAVGIDLKNWQDKASYACAVYVRGTKANFAIISNKTAVPYAFIDSITVHDLGRDPDDMLFNNFPKTMKVYTEECGNG